MNTCIIVCDVFDQDGAISQLFFTGKFWSFSKSDAKQFGKKIDADSEWFKNCTAIKNSYVKDLY